MNLKKFAITAVLATSLLGSTLTGISAQTVNDTFDENTGTTGGTTTQANDNQGFDWRWLLPLLAVPLVFLLFRRGDDDSRREYRRGDLAGTKGGERTRIRDDEF
jgi:hypothetical protein